MDKLRSKTEFESLATKHVGLGHPDITSGSWLANVQKDTLSSIVGHPPVLQLHAIAKNTPAALVRTEYLNQMLICHGNQ